jgi:hypothetical protein
MNFVDLTLRKCEALERPQKTSIESFDFAEHERERQSSSSLFISVVGLKVTHMLCITLNFINQNSQFIEYSG